MKSTIKRFVFGLLAAGALMASTYAAQAQENCPGIRTMNRSGDEQIHGRSLQSIVASLRDRGVLAVNIEAVSGVIRVDVVDPDCSTHSELLDPDTLRPLPGHWQP